jgi:hypothetical protein
MWNSGVALMNNLSAFDASFVEENKHLAQADFEKLAKRFLKFVNPIRVNSIRKSLDLVPSPFEVYQKEYQNLGSCECGLGIPFELQAVQLLFECSFLISFFPALGDEYFEPEVVRHHRNIIESLMAPGLKELDPAIYNSVRLGSFEIEQKIKEKYNDCKMCKDFSGDIDVAISFAVPYTYSGDLPVQLGVIVNFNLG